MRQGSRRSALYLPASNERAIAKLPLLKCDMAILDLEDAVADDRKAQARSNAISALAELGSQERDVVIRINAPETAHFDADVEALRDVRVPVLVPKVGHVDDLLVVARQLSNRPLWAMIETCQGILNVATIAAASRSIPLEGLVIGANDLAKEMLCRLDTSRHPIWGALGMAVIAARAHGVTILDAVYNRIDDQQGFEDECREGMEFGFDGKTLIHPKQIEACNRIFSPDADEIAWAERIVDVFSRPENASVNALSVEGRMVERLHLGPAERVLARR